MMSEYSEIQKPQLPYVHEFETDQLDSMSDCLAEHGFAVIKNVLNEKTVERLKESVFEGTDPNRDLQIGQSRTRHAWIESGPGAWQMLADEEFMSIHRHLIGTDQLTIHRLHLSSECLIPSLWLGIVTGVAFQINNPEILAMCSIGGFGHLVNGFT